MSDKPMRADWLNVLIVDDEKDVSDSIKRYLKTRGIPDEKVKAVETAEEALDILIENDVLEARDRIHLLLCDVTLKEGTNGATLMEMVRHDITNRPCITSMTAFNQDEGVEDSLRHHTDLRLIKDTDFYTEGLDKAIVRTSELLGSMADPREPEEEIIDSEVVIEQPYLEIESEVTEPEETENIYELIRSGALPDLRNPDSYPKGTKAVLLDVDGTLAKEFVMGRLAEAFVLSSHWSKKFQELIGNLTPPQRKVNEASIKRLYEVHLKSKKGIYLIDDKGTRGEYGEMIEYMNALYAKTMARLRVDDVCKVVGTWAKEDVKRNTFKFTKPLLAMLKDFGFVPSLVTGMPTEALPAYKKAFGAEEAGHALLLATQQEGNHWVYTGEIEDQGGTESSKKKVATEIQRNFDIVLVIGNQSSDLGMMKVGMAKKANQENAPHGKALFVANMFASDFSAHIKKIQDKCLEEFKRGHLQFINFNPEDPDAGDTRFWILEHTATHVFRSERWYQYLEEIPEEVIGKVEETRNRVHEVVYHPKGKLGDENSSGYKKYLEKKKKKTT